MGNGDVFREVVGSVVLVVVVVGVDLDALVVTVVGLVSSVVVGLVDAEVPNISVDEVISLETG